MPAQTVIKVRRDTASNWTTANPTLASGEIGFETNTNKLKVGNGSTAWTSLAYASGAGGVTIATSAPTGVEAGTIWFDSNTGISYVYYDSTWVELAPAVVGPQGPAGPTGATGPTGPQGEPGVVGDNQTFLNPTFTIDTITEVYSSTTADYLDHYGDVDNWYYFRTTNSTNLITLQNLTSLTAGMFSVQISGTSTSYDGTWQGYSVSYDPGMPEFSIAPSAVVRFDIPTDPSPLPPFDSGSFTFKILTGQDVSISPDELGYINNVAKNVQAQIEALKPSVVNIASNTTLQVGKKYFVNTSVEPIALNLPTSGLSTGDEIQIFDASFNAATNPISIFAGFLPINTVYDNASLDVNGVVATFVFLNSTYGWRMG